MGTLASFLSVLICSSLLPSLNSQSWFQGESQPTEPRREAARLGGEWTVVSRASLEEVRGVSMAGKQVESEVR